jgi:hypothetical protein
VWSVSGDERGRKTRVRVQTASKAEVREAGFPPAPHIEEEEDKSLTRQTVLSAHPILKTRQLQPRTNLSRITHRIAEYHQISTVR